MAEKGIENLIPVSERTKDEAREISQKGGIASGEARREKRRIREALEKALSGMINMDGVMMDGYEGMAVTMLAEALKGNVQAFKEIRDTVGEKPKDDVDMSVSHVDALKISFVDKSKPNTQKEKDPKIVTDYTEPIDVKDG